MKYGYVRDSLNNKNCIDKQKAILEKEGVDEIIIEHFPCKFVRKYFKKISKKMEHRKRNKLLNTVKSGDSIYVVNFDRLTRDSLEAINIHTLLKNKSVNLHVAEGQK